MPQQHLTSSSDEIDQVNRGYIKIMISEATKNFSGNEYENEITIMEILKERPTKLFVTKNR